MIMDILVVFIVRGKKVSSQLVIPELVPGMMQQSRLVSGQEEEDEQEEEYQQEDEDNEQGYNQKYFQSQADKSDDSDVTDNDSGNSSSDGS